MITRRRLASIGLLVAAILTPPIALAKSPSTQESAAAAAGLERTLGRTGLPVTDKALALKSMLPLEWEALTTEFTAAPESLERTADAMGRVSAYVVAFEDARSYQAGRAPPGRLKAVYTALAEMARLAQTTNPSACRTMNYRGLVWTPPMSAQQIESSKRLTDALYAAVRDAGPVSAAPPRLTAADRTQIKAAVLRSGATEAQQEALLNPVKTRALAPQEQCAVHAARNAILADQPAHIAAGYWRDWTEPARPTSSKQNLAGWMSALEKLPVYEAIRVNQPAQWHALYRDLAQEVRAGHDQAAINKYLSKAKDRAIAAAGEDALAAPTANLQPFFASMRPYAQRNPKRDGPCNFGPSTDEMSAASLAAYEIALVRAARSGRQTPVQRGLPTAEDIAFAKERIGAYGFSPDRPSKGGLEEKTCRWTAAYYAVLSDAPPETAARFWTLWGTTVQSLASLWNTVPATDLQQELANLRETIPAEWTRLQKLKSDSGQLEPVQLNWLTVVFAMDLVARHKDDLARAPVSAVRPIFSGQLAYLQALKAQNVALCARYLVGAEIPPSVTKAVPIEITTSQLKAGLSAVIAGSRSPVIYDAVRQADYDDYSAAFEKAGGDAETLTLLSGGNASALSFEQICGVGLLSFQVLRDMPDESLGRLWGWQMEAPSNAWVISRPSG